jgi:hypothetical protein
MYEMMLHALRPNGDASTHETIFHKLAYDKSLQGNEAKNLIEKYSDSTSKLEKLLESIRDTTSGKNYEEIDELKMHHKNEIFKLKNAYKQELAGIQAFHNIEVKKLHEKVRQLENVKLMPEVCEIDLSSAIIDNKNEVSTDDYCTEQSQCNNFRKLGGVASKARDRISSVEGSVSTCQSRLRSNQKYHPMSLRNSKN